MKKKQKFDPMITGLGIFVTLPFIIGLILVIVGIRDVHIQNRDTANYDTADGYFSDYAIFGYSDDGDPTYRLIYTYEVGGETYTVATDYGTEAVPELGSTRTVKYDPADPAKSVLKGAGGPSGTVAIGLFFMGVSSVFILTGLTGLGFFDKVKIDVIRAFMGIVFTATGIWVITFAASNAGSLLGGIKSFKLWILIPILFIPIGIHQTVSALFFNKNKNTKKKRKKN